MVTLSYAKTPSDNIYSNFEIRERSIYNVGNLVVTYIEPI